MTGAECDMVTTNTSFVFLGTDLEKSMQLLNLIQLSKCSTLRTWIVLDISTWLKGALCVLDETNRVQGLFWASVRCLLLSTSCKIPGTCRLLYTTTFSGSFCESKKLVCTNLKGLCLEGEAGKAMGMHSKELYIAGGCKKCSAAYRILRDSKIIQTPWP